MKAGGGAAPAGGGRTQPSKLPGGAGAPPAGTMTCREELADGRAFRPADGLTARLPKRGRAVRRRRDDLVAGSAARRRTRRRDGAPRGARVLGNGNAARRKDWCAARCSIPSIFKRGTEKAGAPAPIKNRGDFARPPSHEASAGSLRTRRLASRSSEGAKAGLPGAGKEYGWRSAPPRHSGARQRVRAKRGPMTGSARTRNPERLGTTRGSGFRVRR